MRSRVQALDDQELVDGLVEDLAAAQELQARIVITLGELAERGNWVRESAHLYQWIMQRSELTRTEAKKLARLACKLRFEMPGTEEAVDKQRIPVQKAEVLASVVDVKTHTAFLADEEALIEIAAATKVDRLPAVVQKWKLSTYPDEPQAVFNRLHDERSLRITQHRDGSWSFDGKLDPVEGEILRHQVEHTADKLFRAEDADSPTRTGEQRRADALMELVRRGADVEKGRPSALPMVFVVTDVDTLTGVEGDSSVRFGQTPVPADTARRLACDSLLVKVLRDANGEVLEMGRAVRTVTLPQRRALILRDGPFCVVPGCDIPAEQCQGHHLDQWQDGGATNLDRMCLVCCRHHHRTHDLGETIHRHPDGQFTVDPPPRR